MTVVPRHSNRAYWLALGLGSLLSVLASVSDARSYSTQRIDSHSENNATTVMTDAPMGSIDRGQVHLAQVDSSTVARVQQRLRDLGYDPGPADGAMGRRTQGAITNYQRDTGLYPSGEIDESLLQSLFSRRSNRRFETEPRSGGWQRAEPAEQPERPYDPDWAIRGRAVAVPHRLKDLPIRERPAPPRGIISKISILPVDH